jgi:hypothetical protein
MVKLPLLHKAPVHPLKHLHRNESVAISSTQKPFLQGLSSQKYER